MATLVWVDDDFRFFTGLMAYVEELNGVHLRPVDSVEEAMKIFDDNLVEAVMFDMVLMQNSTYAALGRDSGIHLAEFAISQGVGKFIAYTVLSEKEVCSHWEEIGEGTRTGVEFVYFQKGEASVTEIVQCVGAMLSNGKG